MSDFMNPVAIGNRVWHDLDRDGVQEDGEPGISGVKVHLLNASNVEIASINTDANGVYTFEGVAPGSYKVVIDAPGAAWLASPTHVGDSGLDSDYGVTMLKAYDSGDVDMTIDAGFWLPPVITVDKTVDHASVIYGSTVTYTVTAGNNGPASALGVTVTDSCRWVCIS